MNVVFTASWLKDVENWIVNNRDTFYLIAFVCAVTGGILWILRCVLARASFNKWVRMKAENAAEADETLSEMNGQVVSANKICELLLCGGNRPTRDNDIRVRDTLEKWLPEYADSAFWQCYSEYFVFGGKVYAVSEQGKVLVTSEDYENDKPARESYADRVNAQKISSIQDAYLAQKQRNDGIFDDLKPQSQK